MSFEPMTFRYRENGKTKTVKADSVSRSYSGNGPEYIQFYFDKKQIADFPTSSLLPGYNEKARKLYGRHWLQKLLDLSEISLYEYSDWANRLDGYPNEVYQIWELFPLSDHEFWLMQCDDRIILHIMNNDEITVMGKFDDALKELFPGKPIRYFVTTVKEVVVHGNSAAKNLDTP